MKRLRFNKTHPEYEHATIPTLREVCELLRPTGLWINIELKNSRIFYEDLEEKCVKLVYETGMAGRVFYSSFNHHSMRHMKQIDPALCCGLLYEATMIEPWRYAHALGMDAIHPHFSELQIPEEAARSHALGLKVNVWTANTEREIRDSLLAGADTVISNSPDRALKVRSEIV